MKDATRIALALALAVGYVAYRNNPRLPIPIVPVAPVTGLAAVAQQMTAEERSAVHDFYEAFGRAIAADPENEPVFATTTSVRTAHRAGMLVVWRGILDNNAGKYPTLRDELEKFLASAVGMADVPLNPARKQEIGKAFISLGGQFQ